MSTTDDPLLALLEDYNKGDLEENLPIESKNRVKQEPIDRLLL